MNKRKRQDDRLYKKNYQTIIDNANGLCELCGALATEVHHIIFRSQLGTSELPNLICLCRKCHEQAHGVQAKEIRAVLLAIVKERSF